MADGINIFPSLLFFFKSLSFFSWYFQASLSLWSKTTHSIDVFEITFTDWCFDFCTFTGCNWVTTVLLCLS